MTGLPEKKREPCNDCRKQGESDYGTDPFFDFFFFGDIGHQILCARDNPGFCAADPPFINEKPVDLLLLFGYCTGTGVDPAGSVTVLYNGDGSPSRIK